MIHKYYMLSYFTLTNPPIINLDINLFNFYPAPPPQVGLGDGTTFKKDA